MSLSDGVTVHFIASPSPWLHSFRSWYKLASPSSWIPLSEAITGWLLHHDYTFIWSRHMTLMYVPGHHTTPCCRSDTKAPHIKALSASCHFAWLMNGFCISWTGCLPPAQRDGMCNSWWRRCRVHAEWLTLQLLLLLKQLLIELFTLSALVTAGCWPLPPPLLRQPQLARIAWPVEAHAWYSRNDHNANFMCFHEHSGNSVDHVTPWAFKKGTMQARCTLCCIDWG